MSTLKKSLTVSILGIRGQAARHIDLINENTEVTLQHVFHPQPTDIQIKNSPQLPITEIFDNCKESDAILISSPTSEHFSQLIDLSDYPGYILIEKPAVNNIDHILPLIDFPESRKTRIKVNFNFQLNPIAKALSDILDNRILGIPIHATFETNHGAAFKLDWINSWRSTDRFSGPIFTVGIHYVQWLLKKMGTPTTTSLDTASFTSTKAHDSGTLQLKWDDGFSASVITSYASAFKVNFQITGTNGYVTYDGENLRLFSPRDTFDGSGNFATPPKKNLLKLLWADAYTISLKQSQTDFFSYVQNKKPIPVSEFDQDVQCITSLINNLE